MRIARPKVAKLLAAMVVAVPLLTALPAVAQMGSGPRPPDAPGPTVPPPSVAQPRAGETLSDQLQRNDGVIPPTGNLDPDMHKPAPDGGNMPVIRPPSPDGPVQPK